MQVQGVKENMPIKCDKLRRWASRNTYFAAFSEGWATYVENSVVDRDMKMYMNDMERYGMIKHQVSVNMNDLLKISIFLTPFCFHEIVKHQIYTNRKNL